MAEQLESRGKKNGKEKSEIKHNVLYEGNTMQCNAKAWHDKLISRTARVTAKVAYLMVRSEGSGIPSNSVRKSVKLQS